MTEADPNVWDHIGIPMDEEDVGIVATHMEYLERRVQELEALEVAAKYPLSGWQKAEADCEVERAERLFNENSTLRLELVEVRRQLHEAQQSSFYGRLAAKMMKERNKLRQELIEANTLICALETEILQVRRGVALEITTELAKKVGGLQSPMIRMFRKWIAATYLEDGPARPESVEESQQ